MKQTGKRKKGFSISKRESWNGIFFVSFFIIGFIGIYFPAILTSLQYSFSEIDFDFNTVWVGIQNYHHIFRVDPYFVRNLISSFGSLLADVSVICLYSLFICTLLNRNIKGKGVFRALLFLPVIISTGCIEQYMNYSVQPNDIMTTVAETAGNHISGDAISNYILSLSVNENLTAIITGAIQNIYNIITRSGVQIIIFLAGLQSISPSIYEAAKVEGCTAWEIYWKITIPMLSPLIAVNVVYTVVDFFTRPDNEIMGVILEYSTEKLEYGISSAMAWVYFLIISAILGIILLVLNKFIYYET